MSDGGMDSRVVPSRQLIYNKMYYLMVRGAEVEGVWGIEGASVRGVEVEGAMVEGAGAGGVDMEGVWGVEVEEVVVRGLERYCG